MQNVVSSQGLSCSCFESGYEQAFVWVREPIEIQVTQGMVPYTNGKKTQTCSGIRRTRNQANEAATLARQ